MALRSASALALSALFELQVEDLALAHLADAVEAERAERAFDCLALRVENAVLQRDGYTSLDHDCLPCLYLTNTGPVPRTGSFSLMMPRRRATSE